MVVRLKKTHEHNVIATVARTPRSGRRVRGPARSCGRPAVVGPPVLLADGFAAIEVNGRRLAVVGMVLIGVVTLSAVQSVWWAIVPIVAGWVIWLATEEILATVRDQAGALGGAAGGADHRPDDAGGQPPGDPFPGRPPPRGRPAGGRARPCSAVALPIAWTAITGAIGYGALDHQRRRADPPVRRDPRHVHAGRRHPGDADLADRHAPAVPPGDPRTIRVSIARSRPP